MDKIDLLDRDPFEDMVWQLNSNSDLFAKQYLGKFEKAEKRKQSMPWLDKKNKRFYR